MSSFIRATSLQGIDSLITALDGDVNDIFEQCGVTIDLSQLDTQYMSYRQYAHLLEFCAKKLQCPDFGMRLASFQSFDILGPIALVARTGTTLEDALNWVLKYLHVHCPALSLKVNPTNHSDEILISFEILLQPLPIISQVTELSLALMIRIVRQLSGHKCHVKSVYIPHEQSNNLHAYFKHFACEVVSYRNIAGIIIHQDDLRLLISDKQISPVPSSLSYLKQHGAASMALDDRVITLIKPLLAIHQCTNDNIAHALNIHPRQLHRLLKKHDTSFIKLKNTVRQQLARHYLCESQLALGFISELLGYQEQATFSAACQTWFGCSARQLRQQ